MANKYIRHGETYCGDGTSSAAATSNGGVGAWNNINIFTGTAPAYGSLGAGDTVYIRSKDAAGASITIVVSSAAANRLFGSSAATLLAPITWVIDDGSVWSGVSGVISAMSSDHSTHELRANNIFRAKNYNLVFGTSYATFAPGYVVPIIRLTGCVTHEIKVDMGGAPDSNLPNIELSAPSVNYGFWLANAKNHDANGLFKTTTWSAGATFYNPLIELNTAALYPIFAPWNYGANFIHVFGGEIRGVGAVDNLPLCRRDGFGGDTQLHGLKYPRGMVLSNLSNYETDTGFICATGADGVHGSAYFDYRCAYDSRSDGFYPTREAMLETSDAALWSYKLYPFNAAQTRPAKICLTKLHTLAAATKTVTVEILWPTSLPAPTKDLVYIHGYYVDSTTGKKLNVNTHDPAGGTVQASSATWSALTYGATSFTRYKLAVTTPTAIKQDSEVMVTLTVGVKSASVTDIMFIDPDPVLS